MRSAHNGWTLGTVGPLLLEKLRDLLELPEVCRAFVIVDVLGSDVFVQFLGSTERGVLFDVPALGIVARPCATPEDGVNCALVALGQQGVAEGARVMVVLDASGSGPHTGARGAPS